MHSRLGLIKLNRLNYLTRRGHASADLNFCGMAMELRRQFAFAVPHEGHVSFVRLR